MKPLPTFALAALLVSACHHPDATAPPSNLPAAAVRLTTATIESHQATEDVVGTVRSKLRAVIEAKVSGRLLQYRAAPGQLVKAGDLLAELDVQEIRAKREQAKAVLDQAQRDLARQEQLIATKATSQQELDAATARVKVAVAGLNEAETMLGYASVTAPFDGVVTRKLADVGDLAMPGKPLMEIEAPTVLRFETDLPESLLDRIKQGATLPVSIPSLPQPLTATVSEISPVADAVSRTFMIKLDLPEAAGLRPGQFGRVAVPVAETKLLLVPRQAVLRRGQLEAVFVVRDGRGGSAQNAGFQERSEQVARERGGGVRGQDDGGEHDAGPLALQFRGAAVPQGFPPGMQQHVVKRVEGSGEARVQVQAIRVEPEVRQKAAARGIGLVGLMARPQHGLGAGDPAAGGNVPGGVEFRADVGPQSRRVECSGEKAGHADDGNGIVDANHHRGTASEFV